MTAAAHVEAFGWDDRVSLAPTPPQRERQLDPARLEMVRAAPNGATRARCPACAEAGADTSGEHLLIEPSGRYGCAAHPGDAAHRKRIYALAGDKGITPGEAARRVKAQRSDPPREKRSARTWPDADAAARACTPEGYHLAALYAYNRDGQPFAAVARYATTDGKTFRQFRVIGGRWTAGAPVGKWPLFGDVPADGMVFVVEGEKCQIAAASIGLAAVTSAGGACAADKTSWTALAGRDVDIMPDNDPAGEKHAETVAGILATLEPPARVRIVKLPGLPDGGDIADWLDARDAQEPEALRTEIEALAAKAQGNELPGAMDGATVLREDPPPHRPVLAGLFDWASLVEIVGPSKARKSFLVFMLALLLAAGRRAFGFDVPRAFSVCICDMELSLDDIRRRLWRMGRALGIGPEDIGDRLRILTLAGAINARQTIETAGTGYEILVCDPLYALCDGAENIENFRDPLRWLRRLAVQRAAVLFVHHDAKGAAGERDTRDRGSGSGITGRAVDARITLTPAAADPDNTVVMGYMCRSYVTPPASAWTFADDAFIPSDLPAEPERASDRRSRAARPKLDGYHEGALRILRTDGPMSPSVFKRRVRDELHAAKSDADDLAARLCEPGGPAVRWREGGFATAYRIGTKEQADRASRCLPGSRQEAGETR